MKKNLSFYVSFWAVLLIVFNVIAFVSAGWIGCEKYTPAFWCGYTLIMLSFAVNLVCAWFTFRAKNAKQMFYNLAFFRVNYAGLILSFVVGGAFMLTPVIQLWVCVLVAVIAMGMNAVTLVKARTAAQVAEETEDKTNINTTFIKLLTADAKSLCSAARDEQTRQLTQKVYEAVRYSDPVSKVELAQTEQQLRERFDAFAKAVSDSQDVTEAAESILHLIKNRNERCKALK